MTENEYNELERRTNNLSHLMRLSRELCRALELQADPIDMAVEMEKTLEENLKKYNII